MNKYSSKLKLSVLLVFTGLSVACAPNVKSSVKPSSSNPEQAGTNSSLNSAKEAVTIDILESSSMRLNMAGVQKYEFGKYSFPVVNFFMPAQADYVQVIRCRSDANLGELTQIEIGSNNTAIANSKYMEKDYWKKISTNSFCAYITAGTSIDSVVDFYANSGDYIYVARACIEKSRLTFTTDSDDTDFCSRQIAVTPVYRGYVNLETKLSAEQKESLRKQRDKVDAMGREMVYLAKQADQQLSECEKRRFSNEVSKRKRAALGKLLGIGINLGSKLMGDGLGKSIVSGIGSNFASIFEGLSARVDDFLPEDFCPSYDLTYRKMDTLQQSMTTETADYQSRMQLIEGP
ncbi:MAG: hypothetical protein RJB13_2529 [Pseudomonadota bacterium]